jgi:hypothetical protein
VSVPASTGNPLVDAIVSGQAPPAVRLAAARGALPVTRAERLLLCVHLLSDSDPAVRKAASVRLAGEGRTDMAASLDAAEPLAPQVLDHFAGRGDADPALLGKLVERADLSAAALETLSACAHVAVLEQILRNQTRLLANPELIRRLEANPNLGATGRRLLGEFKHDFLERGPQQIVLGRPAEPVPAPAASPVEEAAAAPEPAAEASTESGAAPELTPEESANAAFQAAYVRIMALSVPEKIQLSVKATREERTILVRDSNRLVASGVLKSPKVSDQEVEQMANMRNVSDEVLRIIGTNKNWTRNYSVIYNLCRNPKSPIGIVLPFLNRLNTRDLKNLLTDKNISEAVRKMTKKTFDLRNPTQGGKKK